MIGLLPEFVIEIYSFKKSLPSPKLTGCLILCQKSKWSTIAKYSLSAVYQYLAALVSSRQDKL